MTTGREDRIRHRAHEIWESEGRPDGRDTEHWQQAALEMEDEERGKQEQAETTGAGPEADLRPVKSRARSSAKTPRAPKRPAG